jgi:probable HAF family extracellular repeat protein
MSLRDVLSPRHSPLRRLSWVAIASLSAGSLLIGPALSPQIAAAATTTYTVTTVPSIFGGGDNLGTAINVGGHIVGQTPNKVALDASLFRNGVNIDLGNLTNNKSPNNVNGSIAFAVNSNDVVVGQSFGPGIDNPVRPFIWRNGKMTDLGVFPNDGDVEAQAINNAGVIAGLDRPFLGSGTVKGWVLQNGTTTTIGALGGANGEAFGINDNGQVVGAAETAAPDTIHAFVWQNGVIRDLGALAGTFSEAVAINLNGTAVGVGTVNGDFGTGDRHAVVFQNGSVTDLTPNLPAPQQSFANWINKSGQIVGGSAGAAFIWQNGVGTNLNTLIPAGSGITLTSADGIDDNGQIVANGVKNGSSTSETFLLTPTS